MAEKTTSRRTLDGRAQREAVYALLESFDSRDLDDAALEARTVALLGIAGVTDAASLHAAFVAYAHEHDLRAPGPIAPSMPDPARRADALAAADAILEHRFSFYGETHALPPEIDWEHNPGTGHWGHDLNRFSYLAPLVTAHELTGEARYAQKALDLMLHWVARTDVADAFPPGAYTTNVWSSYLNIAIHLQAWTRALGRIARRSPELLPPAALLRLAKSTHDQLQYLDLVIPEARNNWVTIGVMGQLATLAGWPAFACEYELATRAFQRLEANVRDNVWPDGAQKELTISYHNVVMRNILTALHAAPHIRVRVPDSLRELLRGMLLYSRHLVTPDGMLAAFNDADADTAATLHGVLQDPIAVELLGHATRAPLDSQCFPYAGLMIMRQGSDQGPDELYMAFDGGPYGLSHQHEDKLTLWLSAYGHSLLIDSGRALYDNSPGSFRHYIRRTEAHSTITIDGQSQNSAAHRDTWCPDHPAVLDWAISDTDEIRAAAEYALGYGPDAIAVTHRRIIDFRPGPGYWVVTDELSARGDTDPHRVDSHFQFAPGAAPQLGPGVVYSTYADANLAIFYYPTEWDDITIACGQEDPRAGWISLHYNHITPAPRVTFTWTGRLPARRKYVLMPYRGTELPTRPE